MVFGKSWNVDRDVKANCLYTAGMYVGDTKQVQVQVLNNLLSHKWKKKEFLKSKKI